MHLLDVEVNVMERRLGESLFSEKKLVPEAEQDEMAEVKIGGDGGVEVVVVVVLGLQGEEGLVVCGVLRLRGDVMLEVENQRVQGGGEKVASGIQLQERVVEGGQLIEDAHEGSSVHLASIDEVAHDLFGDLSSFGQILVVGLKLNS